MALETFLSLAEPGRPVAAFFYPELTGDPSSRPKINDVTVFQYWPESLSDSHPAGYAQIPIPGGSHPLNQFVGGQPRVISFVAQFTRETQDIELSRVTFSPSSRYTVDIAGARARIERYLRPKYFKDARLGSLEPPERVVLVFPEMRLGGSSPESGGGGIHQVLCYLTSAEFTYSSTFSDGTPRIMQAALSFEESVQTGRIGGSSTRGSSIKFHGRDRWDQSLYKYTRSDVSIS